MERALDASAAAEVSTRPSCVSLQAGFRRKRDLSLQPARQRHDHWLPLRHVWRSAPVLRPAAIVLCQRERAFDDERVVARRFVADRPLAAVALAAGACGAGGAGVSDFEGDGAASGGADRGEQDSEERQRRDESRQRRLPCGALGHCCFGSVSGNLQLFSPFLPSRRSLLLSALRGPLRSSV